MDNGADSYRRFLDGDNDGFVEIVRDYKDGLILYLNSFTNHIFLAEDLAEDTFVKLGIKKPRYTGKASFKTWLYAIGRNVAIDYLRRNAKIRLIAMDDCPELISEEETLEASYIRKERKNALHLAMRKLKSEHRQVLWLLYFEGFSYKETAKIMKKSVHSLEALAYRAKLSLKSQLDKEGFVYENL